MIVTFDYAGWSMQYPELSQVLSGQAQGYFNQAQLYCDNTDCSIVQNIPQRTQFLWMLTAHICFLNAALNGAPASPLVGRISSAGEGSVNVSTEMQYPPGSPQWYQQTKYGAAYWAASAAYRMMTYVPGPRQSTMPFGVTTIVGG